MFQVQENIDLGKVFSQIIRLEKHSYLEELDVMAYLNQVSSEGSLTASSESQANTVLMALLLCHKYEALK